MEKKPPVKEAAAIKYNPGADNAPVAVAVGRGAIAEKIVESAKEHDIPVVPDANLAGVLSKLGVGDEIPVELYQVVAQILVFVHNVDGAYKSKHGK